LLAELKDGKTAENLVDWKASKLAAQMEYMLVVMMVDMKDELMVVWMVERTDYWLVAMMAHQMVESMGAK
jgi:hypothetical protein